MDEQKKQTLLASLQKHREQLASDKRTRTQFEAVSEITTTNVADIATRSSRLVAKFDQSIIDHTLAIAQITKQLSDLGVEVSSEDNISST